MSEGKKVETEIAIAAEPDAVWRALTEGEEVKRWFTVDARVTPGAGGSMWLSFGEGLAWETPIELWEPNKRLRTADPAPSKVAVDFFIEGRGGETTLRIVHSGFGADAWDDELDTLHSGWRTFAENLRHYLERHRGTPRTVVSYRHPVVPLARAEAFPRMLDALGVRVVEEGEHFDGPLFSGRARVVAPPINFSGTLSSHGDGFLMIEIEPGRGQCRPAVWVSLYGDAGREAAALEEGLADAVRAAFAR